MGPHSVARLRTLVEVMKRPRIAPGVLSVGLVFAGNFAFFTYLRPFLEQVTHFGIDGISGILLVFGVASLVGSTVGGWLVEWSLRRTLALMPLGMSALGLGLVSLGGTEWGDTAMIAAWGVAFGIVPMSWSAWVTQAVPDEAETAGGLIVAAIQMGIAAGAAAGGLGRSETGRVGKECVCACRVRCSPVR